MRYGKLSRQLASLAGPIFIETLLVMMLGAVDTFMLSRHSDNSVAAVGVVNQLMNLVFLLFEVISLGTSILCSQYIGAKRRDKIDRVTLWGLTDDSSWKNGYPVPGRTNYPLLWNRDYTPHTALQSILAIP